MKLATRAASLLLAPLLLSMFLSPATSQQAVSEDGEVDWEVARQQPGLPTPLGDTQARAVRASTVPVLLPQAWVHDRSDGRDQPLIIVGPGWYSASSKDAEHAALITGKTRWVQLPGAGPDLPVRGRDDLRTTRGEGIVEVDFTAFGAVYNINVECFRPHADERCTNDGYILGLANNLAFAGGRGQ